jgi:hypothetical protein
MEISLRHMLHGGDAMAFAAASRPSSALSCLASVFMRQFLCQLAFDVHARRARDVSTEGVVSLVLASRANVSVLNSLLQAVFSGRVAFFEVASSAAAAAAAPASARSARLEPAAGVGQQGAADKGAGPAVVLPVALPTKATAMNLPVLVRKPSGRRVGGGFAVIVPRAEAKLPKAAPAAAAPGAGESVRRGRDTAAAAAAVAAASVPAAWSACVRISRLTHQEHLCAEHMAALMERGGAGCAQAQQIVTAALDRSDRWWLPVLVMLAERDDAAEIGFAGPSAVLARAAAAARPGAASALLRFTAKHSGSLPALARLLELEAIDIDATDRAGSTALLCAVQGTQHAAVELLLRSGADPRLGMHNGWTPLMSAALEGDYALQLLLAWEPPAASSTGARRVSAPAAGPASGQRAASEWGSGGGGGGGGGAKGKGRRRVSASSQLERQLRQPRGSGRRRARRTTMESASAQSLPLLRQPDREPDGPAGGAAAVGAAAAGAVGAEALPSGSAGGGAALTVTPPEQPNGGTAAEGGAAERWVGRSRYLEATESTGATALFLAAQSGAAASVAALVAAGARPDAADQAGATPLHMATLRGCARTVAALRGEWIGAF